MTNNAGTTLSQPGLHNAETLLATQRSLPIHVCTARKQSKLLPLLILCVTLPSAALAQTIPTEYTLLGVGLRTRPAYDGSSSQTMDLVPLLRYYGKHLFARTTQGVLEGGARWQLAPGLNAGVQLAYEESRETDESKLLESLALDDIDAGASVGGHIEWDFTVGPAPISLLGRVRKHVDSSRGEQADARVTAGLYGAGPVVVAAIAQATWASPKSIESFYAVTDVDSRFLHTTLGLVGSCDLSRHWTAVGGVQSRQLQGDAVRSVIVEKKSSYTATVGLAYRF
ncbi:MAG TPA: MipA/OmpV family protein [Thermoanaerobaculia bacterium]|nr:MipA/OmpV family protein [Thermoanaerobaculia bacterium]